MILLDTHALIWLTEGRPQLGDRARQLADEALAHDDLGVSAITFWETAMLHQRGRIQLVQPVEAWRVGHTAAARCASMREAMARCSHGLTTGALTVEGRDGFSGTTGRVLHNTALVLDPTRETCDASRLLWRGVTVHDHGPMSRPWWPAPLNWRSTHPPGSHDV